MRKWAATRQTPPKGRRPGTWRDRWGRRTKADRCAERRAKGTTHPRPAATPFRPVSIPGQLNPLSGQFGSEPSSEAPESIARKKCLPESPAWRLQPHATAHSPGTMVRAEPQTWREDRLTGPAPHHVRRSAAVLGQLPSSSGGGPTTRLTSEGVSALGPFRDPGLEPPNCLSLFHLRRPLLSTSISKPRLPGFHGRCRRHPRGARCQLPTSRPGLRREEYR